jgi:hypothetical protein
VLRALAVLRPASDGTVAAVIRLLGFDLLSSVRPAGPSIPDDPDLDVDEEPVTVPDVDESGSEVLTLVGRSAVEPVSFRDAPTRGALPEGRRRWQDYVPPAAGTPVLAITDLGIGGPPTHPARARAGEWADFAAQLDRRESALVALVPYPRSRWPR